MSMFYCRKSRRQFLVGAGKTMLALPLLPSLLSETAQAQALVPPRRLMMFVFDHNNYAPLWLPKSAATTPVGNIGAKELLLKTLGTTANVSKVFKHPMYQTLLNSDQLSIIRSLTSYQRLKAENGSLFTANDGGHGNTVLAAGSGRNSEAAPGSTLPGHPTIESIIEASQSVYPTLTTPSNVTKALRVQMLNTPFSYQRVGNTIQQASYFPYYFNVESVATAYNQVFAGLTNGTTAPVDNTNQLKSNILNRVYESYVSFKSSRKISADDKSRLDQHMSFISQLQGSYSNIVPPATQTCTKPTTPTNGATLTQATELYMQLFALAFKCGLTKCGSLYFDGGVNPSPEIDNFDNEGFHGVLHGGGPTDIVRADRQKKAFEIWWTYYADKIGSHYLSSLNVEEGSTGKTYIQNMLTGLLCGGGMSKYAGGDGGHMSYDSQQILLGNMGGAIRSGYYTALPDQNYNTLCYNSFLITLLQAMGVTRSEYESTSSDGKGIGNYVGIAADHPYRSRMYDPIFEILT